MKKILYAVFGIAIFALFSSNIKAFDYENCIYDCRNAGSQYNACMASCDANKLIEEKKVSCLGATECINKWENSFSSKQQFFLQCYTGTSDGSYNYCKHDSDACYDSCPILGDSSACKADCFAKDEVKSCILKSLNQSELNSCKGNYNEYLNEYYGNNGTKPGVNNSFDYGTCTSKCTDSNMKECESDCFAQDKVQECINECSVSQQGDCSRVCNESYTGYYQNRLNTYNSYKKIQCGDFNVPMLIPQIVRTIILILQIATPIIIIILGSIDLFKAVAAQKEDEIKKGQQIFFRRLIVGMLVFLVFFIVEFVIGFLAPKKDNYNMWNCVDCFINGDCQTK